MRRAAILAILLLVMVGGCGWLLEGNRRPRRRSDLDSRAWYQSQIHYWKMAELPGCNTTRRRR